jgi:2-polyprenyl-6-methoxyphenol hydroxylase-like FAD-dependent oxidoreductase
MIETDVLIVGFGPTGETLAALLGKAGIKTLVVERDREIYRYPRAAHFDHEIMRIWQKLGLAETARGAAREMYEYEFRNAAGDILVRFDQRGVAAPSGWAPSYMFHQPAIEEALRNRVAELPSVEVRLGTSLSVIERNDDNGVVAEIESGDGRKEKVRARFLIGADGGGSLVRRLIDGELFDYGFDEPWLVIDTVVKDEENLPPFGIQFCDPKRPTTVMPMSPLRRRWEFMLKPGETPETALDDAYILDLLKPWVRPGQAELVRKAVYRFHGLVAKTWRDKSVFLAGDAAHQMPPFMGQGMCSGIRDADNLAWKLVAVLQGDASPALLETYQKEREPHVRRIIEGAIEMGRIVCVQDEQAAAMRDQAMIAARTPTKSNPMPGLPPLSDGCLMASPRAGELFPQTTTARSPQGSQGRLDDLLGDGFWLITAGDAPVAASKTARHLVLDRDITDESGRLNQWLEASNATAVLVRPDRYVFGTGKPEDLVAALERHFKC